jgi:hypothetical protein
VAKFLKAQPPKAAKPRPPADPILTSILANIENFKKGSNAPSAPMMPNPQDMMRALIMKTLPYAIAAGAFLFGSGFGVGWLLKGWYIGSSKPSTPKGTADYDQTLID